MFYYIKIRKIGTAKWTAVREDGKMLIFKSPDSAVKHAEAIKDTVHKIVTLINHPTHKQSPISGMKFKKVGW